MSGKTGKSGMWKRLAWGLGGLALLGAPSLAQATLTVTPTTWNIIGLDSNSPSLGPKYFPVGVRACSDTALTNAVASFNWTTSNAYLNLRSGAPSSFTIPSIPAGGCADAMFEVEVTQTSAAFDTTRGYTISVGGVSSPTPRELKVEHLVSQSRNGVTDVLLDGVSIPAGGSMDLVVGNTYNIKLSGFTATQGYEQLEAFINLPYTIFRINSVKTSFDADTSSSSFFDGISTISLNSPNYPLLYLNGCSWENDPGSPNYLACNSDGKAGGNVTVEYNVTILGGGGSSQVLNTLLHDFSGSSFHYNSDYSFSARTANIVDPTTATIAKSFLPGTIAPGGTSTLTITLGNFSNSGAIPGASVTDSFPSGMTVASPLTYSTTCTGSYSITDASGGALGTGDTGIKISGASIPANSSCTLKVLVTAPTDGTTYSNTTNSLIVNTSTDTGKTASASLTVDSSYFTPPAPPSSCPGSEVTLATWDFSGSSLTYATKHADVSTATATVTGSTASFESASGNIRLIGTNGWTTASTVSDANAPYVEFSVDTSNFGGVQIQYGHKLTVNSDWGGTNNMYTFSEADGGGYSEIANVGASKGGLLSALTTLPTATTYYTAVSTGSSSTSFRIIAAGSKAIGTTTERLELDNVTIRGCARVNYTPPDISKSFSPATIAKNATSTLTFTLTNPNAGAGTKNLTSVQFKDTFPSGVTVASIPASTTCTSGTLTDQNGSALAVGSTGIKLSGATIASNASGNASCTVTVSVTSATAGTYDNVSDAITASESGSNTTSSGIASATLTVVSPPTIAKNFGTDPIPSGGTSTLLVTLTNPNASYAMSGVAFTDSFPAGMTVASPATFSTSNCGTPTFAPVAAAGSISFSGGSIAASGTCTVSVKLTATTGASPTTYTNTTGSATHTINAAAVGTNTASDTLTVNPVNPKISLLKQVSTSFSGPWKSYEAVTLPSNVYYKFVMENAGDVVLASAAVTDPAVTMSNCSWKLSDGVTAWTSGTNLPVGEYVTCVLDTVTPIAASSGNHTNTATAQGSYSAVNYTDTSSATYATTGLTLDKTSGQTLFKAAGDTLSYSYLVSNTGFATLGAISVSDNKTSVTCPSLQTVGDLDNFLDPGESVTCTANYSVAAADVTAKSITNTATATATNPNATSNSDSVTLPLAAELSVSKSNSVGGSVPLNGSSVSFVWTLLLSNSASSGSTASFADTQTLLQDDLPDSGPTYVVGAVKKAGATGTVACTIASNTLSCKASGGAVTLPPGLTGTVAVSNGSTTVTGTGTAFSSQVEAGARLVIAGVAYTVASVTSNTQLELTAPYAGANASGLALPSTISVPVTVTVAAGGVLANPKSGGSCKIDPGNLVTEIDDSNNNCSDSVTVTVTSLLFMKTVATISDPVNGTTKPYSIPGAVVEYTLTLINSGTGTADADSIYLTDTVPANMKLLVCSDPPACTNATPPITFTCSSTPACGLTYTHASDISYTNKPGGAAPFDYVPVPDANGYDSAVTGLKLNPKGAMSAASPPDNASASFKLRMQIQ